MSSKILDRLEPKKRLGWQAYAEAMEQEIVRLENMYGEIKDNALGFQRKAMELSLQVEFFQGSLACLESVNSDLSGKNKELQQVIDTLENKDVFASMRLAVALDDLRNEVGKVLPLAKGEEIDEVVACALELCLHGLSPQLMLLFHRMITDEAQGA